ncbi:MAG: hypothetical protein COA79_06595 [Planctomycetota bacterium]|nr:MAG: hypothetical protein COA79_06595 [Planctomycetota bacterium]
MDAISLKQLLYKIEKIKVGIIGDFCLDCYWELDSENSATSVETFKKIHQIKYQRVSPGGAGNLANNLKRLNVETIQTFGVIGNDSFGRELKHVLTAENIQTNHLFTQEKNWSTNTYIKPLLLNEEQERFDFGEFNILSSDIEEKILNGITDSLKSLDLFIINQQFKNGLHSNSFREKLSKIILENPDVPFLVDSRDFPSEYQGSIRKLNDYEVMFQFNNKLKPEIKFSFDDLKEKSLILASKYNKPLIVTRGSKGCLIIEDENIIQIPGLQIQGKTDTVGAGDSFLSGLSATYACEKDLSLGAQLGNLIASITIKKLNQIGTASPNEIKLNFEKSILNYQPDLAESIDRAVYLKNSNIEIVEPIPQNLNITHAIFDHDGTISTIRHGWEEVMQIVMYELITNGQNLIETEKLSLETEIDSFIEITTGIRTLEQMDGLKDLIIKYKNVPNDQIKDRFEYKKIYLTELMKSVKIKVKNLEDGNDKPELYAIKDVIPFLNTLHEKGITSFLASGTDEVEVKKEAKAMKYANVFNGGIYGARDSFDGDIKSFVMNNISKDMGQGNLKNTVVFGDGPVEIREGRKRGAITIGVASDEIKKEGIDAKKRQRLIKAGAHIIIGDYLEADKLIDLLNL